MVSASIELAGYQIHNLIYNSARSLVYRGRREVDQKPAVIKILNNPYPSDRELVQFRNQYNIAKNLNALSGVVQPLSLESYNDGYALVMEDFGGISLAEYAASQPLSLPLFLQIAIQIASILSGLHRHRVIHKDIKPANILINLKTQAVKLIDFSIASVLPRETQALKNPNQIEGTLTYLSPEQSGRMNRGIDWRSDFYSLGVTFFELLTGELPFVSNDPMELVHCHIAKLPRLVHTVNEEVPPILSQIVAKLMAKNAEDRYQTALGIQHDLEICLHQLKETGTINDFQLGQRDISDRFAIAEKLYGREQEVANLLAAFDRVTGKIDNGKTHSQLHPSSPHSPFPTPHSPLILVTGFSGIGKTAVVNEIHKPIVKARGYFIKGKFDQLGRNIPLDAFVQAFRDLMGQLLTESKSQLEVWKLEILNALGGQAKAIAEVIPELENIIGCQPPIEVLSATAAQNRFNLLFQNFIQVFAKPEHPLAIFLDDLQWADSASLKLMQLLTTELNRGYLLIIGAYRHNEVSAAHPLKLTLDEIQQTGVAIDTINLAPLTKTDLNHLITDTLKLTPEKTLPLAEQVYQKTQGNPFFSGQLLKSLHEDGLICFDFNRGVWSYDIEAIKTRVSPSDVVEFVSQQLQKLPEDTQGVLSLAACIGNKFDLPTLSFAYEKSLADTAADLWKALQEGFILPQGEAYKVFQGSNELIERSLISHSQHSEQIPTYKFLHDRVQQAAYSLIKPDQKGATHLKIGKLLLKNTESVEKSDKIFEIVNQLNLGIELIQEPRERNELAQLNLIAGEKAKASTAYSAGLEYLNTALKLLPTDSWNSHYNLTLTIYEAAVELAFLNSDFSYVNSLANLALENTKSIIDTIKFNEVIILSLTGQNKHHEAIKVGLSLLKLLDIELPENPDKSEVMREMEQMKSSFYAEEIANLVNLPIMTEAKVLAALNILSYLASAAFKVTPGLLPLITLKQIELSVKYGNSDLSCIAYSTYAYALCNMLGDIDLGYKFSQLAVNLSERIDSLKMKGKVLLIINNFIVHWKEHVRKTLKPLLEAYSCSLSAGDFEYVGYSGLVYCFHSYFAGKELAELEQEMIDYGSVMSQTHQQQSLALHKPYWQAVLNLLGKSEDPCCLTGDACDELELRSLNLETNNIEATFYFYLNKVILCYLFSDHVQSVSNAVIAEKYLSGALPIAIFNFYDSLAHLAVYPSSSEVEQEAILKKVATNQEKMQQWVHHTTANHLHKYYLVEAELHRVQRQYASAVEYYERAIAIAKENEYVNEEALALELAAKFYLGWGKEKIAQAYMADAYYRYGRWGASAKVNDLEKRYPQLLAPILHRDKANKTTTISGTYTTTGSSCDLDLATVVKASQAISGEIHLDKLLSTLMQVVLENAGAEKCALILPQDENLVIAAYKSEEASILSSIPVERSQDISQSIINYVFRTKETLVIDDATNHTTFASDRYITAHQPKSLLCTPIINQGQLIGILYLENNLATGAFTQERLEVLRLLTSQAAISLSNAILYKDLAEAKEKLEDYNQTLEHKVEQRTQQLNEKNQHLQETLLELKRTQAQLIQTEKMSSLGQMVAGVAHEINNPVNFIYGNVDCANDYIQDLLHIINLYQHHYPEPIPEIENELEDINLEFLQDDLQQVLKSMKNGAKRIREIVLSLRNFSRLDEADMKSVDLHEGIDNTLLLLQHRLKNKDGSLSIEIIKEYANLPQIDCYASQLNQVFLNILGNAIDALEGASKPRIKIVTEVRDSNTVTIRIADNGSGIPEDIQTKLFDPFFTTKPVGKGTGLGLSISYQIVVEKHGGTLECISSPGNGAEFAIAIPVKVRSGMDCTTKNC